jgi:CheY-like chemotaxis protein
LIVRVLWCAVNGQRPPAHLPNVFYGRRFATSISGPAESGHGEEISATVESRDAQQMPLPFDDVAKLLVVDDHAETREILQVYFSGHGFEVTTAGTGKEALEAIERIADFDVVLLDVFLPSVGGMEVLTEINRRKPRPSVILLTGLADREIAHDALRLGAFDYILKPFNLLHVEDSVNACLAHREYSRQSWWKRVS